MHFNEFRGFFIKICTFLEEILPIFFWVLLIFGFDEPSVACVTIISAIIHESGHVLCLHCLTKGKFHTRGALSGIRIRKRLLPYKDEIILALFGPLFNLLGALVSLFLIPFLGDGAQLFFIVNLASAISNLLPVEGYDGYAAIKNLVLLKELDYGFLRALEGVSFFITAFFSLLSLYVMARLDGGYWVYALFSFSLITKISKSLKNTFREI